MESGSILNKHSHNCLGPVLGHGEIVDTNRPNSYQIVCLDLNKPNREEEGFGHQMQDPI